MELDYVGTAPDIGPYEYGAKDYWIPGRQLERASRPVPPDGSTTVKADADLMWLGGYKADIHDVYFNASADEIRRAKRGDPCFRNTFVGSANSFDPGALVAGRRETAW
jgi:hypothetical protein